jgi:hypothetical protein
VPRRVAGRHGRDLGDRGEKYECNWEVHEQRVEPACECHVTQGDRGPRGFIPAGLLRRREYFAALTGL